MEAPLYTRQERGREIVRGRECVHGREREDEKKGGESFSINFLFNVSAPVPL